MKVLVTGAGGFIGQYLVRALLKKGIRVICLLRDPGRFERNNEKIEVCKGDLLNPETFQDSLNGVDAVFHLAGSVHSRSLQELNKTNVIGTANIFASAVEKNVKAFIFVSSLAAVGPARNGRAITEDTISHPLSQYGRSKLRAEQKIERLLQPEMFTRVLIIRAPLIYGVGMNVHSRMITLIDSLLTGRFRFIGNGNNNISLCHVQNLIDFLCLALTMPFKNQIELVCIRDEELQSFREIVLLLCQLLKIKKDFKNVSPIFARVIAGVGDLVERITGIENFLPYERALEISSNWSVDISKARRMGYRGRVKQNEGFQEMIQWYIGNQV